LYQEAARAEASAAGSGAAWAADAFAGTDHVGQPHAETVVHHDDLAMRDQRAVDEHVQRFAGGTLQFDHGALVELQQVADRDAGMPDHQ